MKLDYGSTTEKQVNCPCEFGDGDHYIIWQRESGWKVTYTDRGHTIMRLGLDDIKLPAWIDAEEINGELVANRYEQLVQAITWLTAKHKDWS